jgi:hypothetical protein
MTGWCWRFPKAERGAGPWPGGAALQTALRRRRRQRSPSVTPPSVPSNPSRDVVRRVRARRAWKIGPRCPRPSPQALFFHNISYAANAHVDDARLGRHRLPAPARATPHRAATRASQSRSASSARRPRMPGVVASASYSARSRAQGSAATGAVCAAAGPAARNSMASRACRNGVAVIGMSSGCGGGSVAGCLHARPPARCPEDGPNLRRNGRPALPPGGSRARGRAPEVACHGVPTAEEHPAP